jgi:DNA-binding MarR family transcriptional regulator
MERAAALLELDDPDRSPLRSFGFRLWHVEHAWNRRLEAALAPFDLTHMQYVLLRAADHLAKLGERPAQARLAECLVTDKMMVSKVLRLLEGKGLIVRAVHPEDSRANHVVLTEAGRRTLARAIDVALTAQETFFGRLGEGRKRALGAMLDDLLEMEGNPVFRKRNVSVTTKGEGAP